MKKILLLLLAIVLVVLQKSNAQTPVAHYSLNGNTNDVSGNNLNGTLTGTLSPVLDRFGSSNSALNFNGSTRIDVTDNPLLRPTNVTLSAWVYYTSSSGTKMIASKNLCGGTGESYGIFIINGTIGGAWSDGPSTNFISAAAPVVSQWHLITFTFDDANNLASLYLDGVLATSQASTLSLGYDNSSFSIGSELESCVNSFFYDGAIDDVKIYNVALTAPQVLAEFNAVTGQNYRSVTSGNWGAASTWEVFDGSSFIPATVAPSSADGVITIRNGHNVTVNSAVTTDQTIVETGGTLTQNNALTLSNGSGDDLTVNGNWIWNSNNMAGAGNVLIASTGTLTLATGNQKNSDGYNITNNGIIDWQDGFLNFGTSASSITNNGLFTISGNNSINSGVPFTIINTGTITKASSGTTSILNGPISLNNSGTINFNAGIFNLDIASTNSGIWSFGGGTVNRNNNNVLNWNSGASMIGTGAFSNSTSTITLNANLTIPATISFTHLSGTINGSGNLTLNSDFATSGTISGAGLLTVNGNTTWLNGSWGRSYTIPSGNTLTITSGNNKFLEGATITNNGTINWQDGFIGCGTLPSTITNNSQFNINGNNDLASVGAGYLLTNNGVMTKTSTGTSGFSGGSFVNTNTGNLKGLGTFNISNPFTNNGTIAPGTSPGIITFNNAQPLSANSTLGIEMLNGTGPGTGYDQLARNGSLTLAGTLTVTELSTMPNGTYTIINLTVGNISGSFSTTNLPLGYALQVNATNVELIRTGSTLPLNLITFTGNKQNNDALLQWKTANEINVAHFEIQRSADGQGFVTVGTVLPGSFSYSYTDAGIFNSKPLVFYRLKSIDNDAKFTYSNIVRLSSQLVPQLSVFPNPVKDVVIISGLQENGIIRLFANDGKLLHQQKVQAQSITLNMAQYAKGVYVLQYKQEGKMISHKIIKE